MDKYQKVAELVLWNEFRQYISDDIIAGYVTDNDMKKYLVWNEKHEKKVFDGQSLIADFTEYNSHLLEDGGYWNDNE